MARLGNTTGLIAAAEPLRNKGYARRQTASLSVSLNNSAINGEHTNVAELAESSVRPDVIRSSVLHRLESRLPFARTSASP